MQKEKKVLLGLKLPTDPRWINIVEKDLEAMEWPEKELQDIITQNNLKRLLSLKCP